MNRREMVVETGLALFAVTAIVVGNFLVQRYWTTSQSARVADAAAEGHSDARSSLNPLPSDEEFIRPRPASELRSANTPERRRRQLKKLVYEQMPDVSSDEREAWLEQLQDLPLEAAVGILEARKQVGSLTGKKDPPLTHGPVDQPTNHDDNRIFSISAPLIR